MTAEIINLRQARKRRAREADAAQAAENRVRFGRTSSERERDDLAAARARLLHEGHRREPGDEGAAEDAPADPTTSLPAPEKP